MSFVVDAYQTGMTSSPATVKFAGLESGWQAIQKKPSLSAGTPASL
jgi:hypothetical protein